MRFGKEFVIHGKAPTFPQTYNRERRMGSGQVRYWSLCTYARVTTAVQDCVADYQVPLDRHGYYTIVISRPKDRPANATKRCGVAWVSFPLQGDAAGDPDQGQAIMRQILPAPRFTHSILRITRHGQERSVMRRYYPQTSYTSRAAFKAPACSARARHTGHHHG